ncbi:MAG: S41 family peptidase [Anaerolineales bacterium]|nr:S41 family peptidase [Anaerolineales bacterium]
MTPAGKRIGYVLIPTFNENSIDKKIAQAIQELSQEAPLDGLILDNRHNGGGQSEIMLNTLANFVNGDVGYFVQHGTEDKIQVQGVDLAGSQSLSLVVLVGDGTVSFGEVFAGILQDLSRATIIGSQTNGNTELMRVFDFFRWLARLDRHCRLPPLFTSRSGLGSDRDHPGYSSCRQLGRDHLQHRSGDPGSAQILWGLKRRLIYNSPASLW